MKDCTTCKYGYEDDHWGIPMCHHPKRFSEDCVDFNMHEEKHLEGKSDKSLEEAAEEYYQKEVEETKCHHASALTYAQGYEDALLRIKKAFKAGAEWQKEQDMKKLEANWGEGFRRGKAVQKEQMLKDAVEGWVAVDADTMGNRRVSFFPQKPVRDLLTRYKYWAATRPNYEVIRLDLDAFPDMKWEDEPKKVRVVVLKAEEE